MKLAIAKVMANGHTAAAVQALAATAGDTLPNCTIDSKVERHC